MAVLQPPAIALMGVTGAGKSDACATLIEAGLETFYLGTEPNAVDVVIDSVTRRKLNMDLLHYHQLVVASPGWDDIMQNASLVQSQSFDSLTKQQFAKGNLAHWMNFLKCLKDFDDQRTGKKFGDVTTWGITRALVIDSMSGLNKMAREYVVGYKPTMHMGEWGIAMQLEENIIYKLIADRSCFFVLVTHLDKEVDELTGQTSVTMAALGKKLAPQLMKFFSEAIIARRELNNFYWSTTETNATTKTRSLALSNKLEPSFVPIVNAYRARAKSALISSGQGSV